MSATSRDEPVGLDTSVAHQARVYDYLLGGKDNYAADREAGETVIAAYPDIVFSVRANRAFLARVVRYLAGEAGIRQFLDIGTGIPTANNTHEVAQGVAPECRVVYVDYDPIVLAHARALLTSDGLGDTAYIDADLRDTGPIIAQAAETLDLSQPVAVLLLSIMHVIPDSDGPQDIAARLMAEMSAGSYLALSHPASDIHSEEGSEAARRLNQTGHQPITLRDTAQVGAFFAGLEMVPPGLVPVQRWRPAVETKRLAAMWAGLGLKR
jgi:hypothetical protein